MDNNYNLQNLETSFNVTNVHITDLYYCLQFIIDSEKKNYHDYWGKGKIRLQEIIRKLSFQQSGAPSDCFLWNICSEKKKLPRIFDSLRKAKNFYVTVPFIYNFRNLSNIFSTIFWSLIFPISLHMLGYFSYRKENLKLSGLKMRYREESKKLSLL